MRFVKGCVTQTDELRTSVAYARLCGYEVTLDSSRSTLGPGRLASSRLVGRLTRGLEH